jgi:hypothetical protein
MCQTLISSILLDRFPHASVFQNPLASISISVFISNLTFSLLYADVPSQPMGCATLSTLRVTFNMLTRSYVPTLLADHRIPATITIGYGILIRLSPLKIQLGGKMKTERVRRCFLVPDCRDV